jgi:2-aminoadipate transaminase
MRPQFAVRMDSVHRSFIREILKVTADPEIISFAGGLPNPRFFPLDEVGRAAAEVIRARAEPPCSTPRPRATRP